MSFTNQELDELLPGCNILGVWTTINANHNNTFENTSQVVAAGVPEFASSNSDTTSYVDYIKWRLVKNLDNQAIGIYLVWKITSAGTITAKLTVDGSDNASITTTNTSLEARTISLTPTTATDGREVVLSIRQNTSTIKKAKLHSVACYVIPAAGPSAGVYNSGFSLVDATPENDDPINTEMMSRILDGPVQVAKDRPQCIYSFFDNYHVPDLTRTSSVTYVTALTAPVPFPDGVSRDYEVFVLLSSNDKSSGVPSAQVFFGGKQIGSDVSGIGWHTFTLSNVTNSLEHFQTQSVGIKIKTNNASYTAGLSTVQVVRKPE